MTVFTNSYLARASGGLAVALSIGVAAVATCNAIWAVARRAPLSAAWDDASATQVMIASAPYVMLALLGVSERRPWYAALCLTVAFWGFYAYSLVHADEGGGANIGLGILMMLSPLPTAAVGLLSLLTLRRGPKSDRAGDVS